jgi:hypothetical protein
VSISCVEVADEVYSRLRELLCIMPEVFCATQEGLTVPLTEIDDHVLRFGSAKSIPRSVAASAARADQYLLRATGRSWILLPQAFGCDDEYLPAGVVDRRHPIDVMSA